MAEEKEVKSHYKTKRIFINNIDHYSSKWIARFLSTCVVGASVEDEGERIAPDEGATLKEGAFQVVGSVNNKTEHCECNFALEKYQTLNREELLPRLMECDFVIYNISENADQIDEASWAVSALHAELDNFESPKTFILISTVMTWALSKPIDPDDPEIPFTEDDYRRRRPHPHFKDHTSAEKLVIKMGKTKKSRLSTYVVASGLQYGMGEHILHFFFKMSWMGEVPYIPVFGPGNNIIPTVHVNDLASVIQNIIDHKPKKHYLVAVDDSKNTFEDIVKAISFVLGPGKIQGVPKEDVFLTRDLMQTAVDHLLVNLRIEAVFLKENFNLLWVSESGIVENIERVVEEYKQTRGLLPIRICILGPPAVGKSTVAEKICKHYKLHHIKVKDTISETMGLLEKQIQLEDGQKENEESSGMAQELLETLKENMDKNGGQLDDQFVIRIMGDKLKSTQCKNQGFVLDGFPKTYEQAKVLFYEDEEDSKSKIPPFNKKIIPEHVFCMVATDAFLKSRVLNLPEEGTDYSQSLFLHNLESYRENNVEDETVLNYFDELEIHPEHIEITSSDDMGYLVVTDKIFKAVGEPKNYGPSMEELEEQEQQRADERLRRLASEMAEVEQKEAEKASVRVTRWEEWSKRLEEVKKQEQELLEAQSIPLRNYLVTNVIPTLTQGLIDCCRIKPADPVDFLAEFLFMNNLQVD